MQFKRSIFTCVMLLASCAGLFAQAKKTNPSPYVFPEFVKGTVLQKSGGVVEAVLNYNTITQEMMFAQNGSNLVMDQADNIDTIYIENRKFIPARSVYFEKLTETSVPLYIQYKSKALKNGTSYDMGGGSNAAIGGFVGTRKDNSGPNKIMSYDMNLPDGYQIKTENEYWVQKGGAFYPTTNMKKIVKLFPGKETAIDAYIKENNISMTKQEDVVKLIMFANK